jgi:putative protein kinase ArgK-like GTPase of G3E family
VATDGTGLDELLEAVETFREHQSKTDEGRNRRRRVVREKIRAAVDRRLRRRLWDGDGEAALEAAAEAGVANRENPYELAAAHARRLNDRDARAASSTGG